MIIYEVNLIIQNEIFNDYYEWLNEPLKRCLNSMGLKKLSFTMKKNCQKIIKPLTIHYVVKIVIAILAIVAGVFILISR